MNIVNLYIDKAIERNIYKKIVYQKTNSFRLFANLYRITLLLFYYSQILTFLSHAILKIDVMYVTKLRHLSKKVS